MVFACIVPLILILVAGGVFLAISRSKKADEAWLEASKRLKLRFDKTGTFGKREMTGKVDNFNSRVQTITKKSANNSSTFTQYTVRWQKRRRDYRLTRSKALSAVASFFGAADVEIGSAEFDRGVVVNSEHPTDIRDFLTAERQKQVMRVLLSYPGATIKNGKVEWKERGVATSSAQIEGVIRRFTKLARVMSSDHVFKVDDEPDVMRDSRAFRDEVERSEWHWKRGDVGQSDEAARADSIAVGDDRQVHALAPVFEPVEETPVAAPEPAPSIVEPTSPPVEPVHVEPLPVAPVPAASEPPEPAPVAPIPLIPAVPLPVAPVADPEPTASPESEPSDPAEFAEHAALQVSELHGSTEAPAQFQALPETSFGSKSVSEPTAPTGFTSNLGKTEPVDVSPDPAPEPAVSVPSGPTELAASAVSEDLFAGNQLGMDVTKTFEEHYQDRPVRWSGKLERVDSYYSDFVFGSTPGAKANIEIYELRDEPYGNATIRAVVQLTQEEGESLRARSGETIAFEGQLVRCEPYMRNLLVAHGRLV